MVILGSNKKVIFCITRFPVAIKGLPWEIWLLLPTSTSSGAASTATISGWNIFSPVYQEQQADAQSIDDRDVTKLKKSFFKIQRQTILLVHGFTVTGESMN